MATRASDWSIRLGHELAVPVEGVSLDASFITLTYSSDEVIDVDKPTCQDFLKRLRRRLEPKKIRYYLVSEYGTKGSRPHYHAIVYGHDFSKDSGSRPVKSNLYTSPLLEAAWGLGHVSSGSASPASIRYVSNYVLEKSQVPTFTNPETSEVRPRAPVFALMSRKPGIGAAWIDRHSGETYRDDNVVSSGFSRQPPRYYDSRSFSGDQTALMSLKLARRNAKLQVMQRSPSEWLANNHPLRRSAEVAISKSKRALSPKGDL